MDLDYGAICVTIPMVDLREYLDLHGPQAAAKIATALTRLSLGNMSNVKGAGSGVFEVRIDFGPGYRVYFGKDGDHLIILLGGGGKQRQQRDINAAIATWADYKRRKYASDSRL